MTTTWAASEVGTARLGDARRNTRLITLLETLATHPTASLSEACGTWAATKAAYRFFSSSAIEPSAITAAHRTAAISRIQAQEHALVLAIQDTTELNFTSHPALAGRGRISRPGQYGILVHSVLAVSATGVPLGLLHQQSWTRDPATTGKATTRRQRPSSEKESQRWLDGQEATLAALPPELDVLTIADAEADIYDLLAAPRRDGADILIRATHNRRLATEEEDALAYLWTTLGAAPRAGRHTITLGATPTRGEREAILHIRVQTVTIAPPHHHLKRAQCRPITVGAILVTEEEPPAGVEAVSWRLLTTVPVSSLADALALVEAYTVRWLVERYHFVLKSGCRIEALQLDTVERMERALAAYAVVAWRLLWLAYLAREEPDGDGEGLLTPREGVVLGAWMEQHRHSWPEQPTTREVVRAIARMGGFLGRRGDGEPGVKVLWRGLRTLDLLVEGYDLARAHLSSVPRA
jgi:hypothetical protein